ncbi:hypothetical protein [Paenibacillus sp. USHLN196]|uniref:hypothetical protein n=1 Tax=Paenibacillus sp. USHLN196 TaxID=3081291 RepID=UPI0030178064
MANRYTNLVGSRKISEDFNNINIGFDRVQAEMDTKGTPADAQAKADAAEAAAIAAASADLAAHKARGADEHPTAKGNAAGFMSAADKLKSDASTSAATPDTLMQRDAVGRAKVTAPVEADDIARKAETDAVQSNLESHAADTDIHVTADDHAKLDGIAEGAEVNQNAFAVINDVEASSKSDTLQLTGGTGITVTTDPATKRVIVTSTGTATPGAHASSHVTGGSDVIPDAVTDGASGLMSGADAKFVRLDGESKAGAQAKADEVKDYIESRLDTPERAAITLQPGIHVVQTDQDAAFKLAGLQGRTLVNLLGRDGNFEDTSRWSVASCNLTLDNTSFLYGNSSGKATATGTNSSGLVRSKTLIPVNNTKYIVAIVEVNNTSATSAYLRVMKPDFSVTLKSSTPKTAKGSYLLHYVKLSPADLIGLNSIAFDLVFPYVNSGSVINIDGGGVYEVDKALYDRIGVDITESNIRNYLPYVDSIQPVRNPYAIRYGENLLPPFYEWETGIATGDNMSIDNPHKVTINATTVGGSFIRYYVPVIPSQQYTIAVTAQGANARAYGYFCRGDKTRIDNVRINFGTITPPQETVYFEVALNTMDSNYNKATGTAVFTEASMIIGNVAKPFKPREDAMLALQTDLYADPVTGLNADEVFEKDGQYFKLAKWKRLVLDGNLSWGIFQSFTGYKQVMFPLSAPAILNVGYATKYNGSVLTRVAEGQGFTAGDQFAVVPKEPHFTISNTDSGWGDSYTPTADEIKAYFMGWRMYDGTASDASTTRNTPYTTGTKFWRSLDNTAWGYTSPPNTPATGYTPYQLLYQLATPIVEPITSEGQLTLIEGNNQVEVGTGIVLREKVNPYANAAIDNAGINAPSSPNYPGTGLKTKVRKLRTIYKNGSVDNGWAIKPGAGITGGGEEYADIKLSQYDASATYTVTYLMLDKYPAAPFVGSVAENEKALLTDLVQDVQQASARLSVVESKKAENEAPAWIAPTLLNGWAGSEIGYRVEGKRVFFKGSILNGVITSGPTLFTLPLAFRPKRAISFTLGQYSTSTHATGVAIVDIYADGRVVLSRGEHNVVCFQGESYSID